jgi:quinol-cytochrome oxidoreductase complex cytochrome b subunit
MRIVKTTLGPLYSTAITYPTPANLTYMYNFGSIAFVLLLIQIITGIFW